MDEQLSPRVEQALERFGEDETLSGDLPDPAAIALLSWIETQVKQVDQAVDDASFEQQLMAIRRAAKTAARAAAEADDPQAVVIAAAQAALQTAMVSASPATQPPQPAVVSVSSATQLPESAGVAVSSPTQPQESVTATPKSIPTSETTGSIWQKIRRRVRRWTHRKG